MSFADFEFLEYLANIVDILLVWFVIYKLIAIIRGTKAVQLLKGIFVILIVKFVSDYFGLNTLSWMMEQVLTWGFLAIIIIFQRVAPGTRTARQGAALCQIRAAGRGR
ncbi:hypothetical protein JCM21738_4753 [Mesobacillus boroniphilus JCM 21738]|uniref:Diadenylate cyclase CdaA N-terminal domain-containing protein n=1 Tax=Mesobacillus boroniphilus JCM 21738 TaxID=1294265 RepID=W4RTV0_9BACI|nr:hypothetical protein JCM21738_4753 [Mesobacillus boroniphilus JCM 21738]